MSTPIRYDAYYMAPRKIGVQHFGTPYTAPLEKDQNYTFLNLYKEALILSFKVTSVTDVTGLTLKMFAMSGNAKVFDAFYQDKSLATAVTDSDLTLNVAFANYKPDKFTLGDCVAQQSAITIPDFNVLRLGFMLTGADVPENFKLSFVYEMAYQA